MSFTLLHSLKENSLNPDERYVFYANSENKAFYVDYMDETLGKKALMIIGLPVNSNISKVIDSLSPIEECYVQQPKNFNELLQIAETSVLDGLILIKNFCKDGSLSAKQALTYIF